MTAFTDIPPTFKRKRILVLLVLFVISFVLMQLYFRYWDPAAREIRRFINEMPADKIQEIRLEPYTVLSLTNHPITIRDRQQITQLADLLRAPQPTTPNHPAAIWVTVFHIKLADKEYTGNIESTKYQGVLIEYSDGGHGIYYGTYRQDALGPMLEKIVASN